MALAFMVEIAAISGSGHHVERSEMLVELYEQEGAALLRLARIFTDDRNAAEDLVQEAFIRLYRTASRVRDTAKLPAYLRSIVLNLARDHNRRGLLSLRHHQPLSGVVVEAADEDLLRTERQDRVVMALGDLSARQRECLVLRYFLDLSESEIAMSLGISTNSVKTHTRRGLVALERILEDLE